MAEVYMAGDFRNGTTFEMEGNVFKVVEFQHVKPGKGAAFVRTKLKNVITGAVLEKTFNPSEKYPGAEIEKRDMQYLYVDGDLYYFMDNETYEQMPLNKEQIGDALKYIKENMSVKVLSYKGNVFAVEPPMFVELEVTYTEPGFSGNTTTTSGKNSSMPHAVPTDKLIEPGDPITIDMGCKVNGYCSDMTRTIFAGFVPQAIKPIYDFVLKTQIQVIENLKEGSNVRSVSKMVDNNIKLNGFEVMHSLGHGVGLEIHEYPYFSNKTDFLLKENMVITDEPGVYIQNKFGVRIEDTLLINKFGSTSLTKSDKNYVVI